MVKTRGAPLWVGTVYVECHLDDVCESQIWLLQLSIGQHTKAITHFISKFLRWGRGETTCKRTSLWNCLQLSWFWANRSPPKEAQREMKSPVVYWHSTDGNWSPWELTETPASQGKWRLLWLESCWEHHKLVHYLAMYVTSHWSTWTIGKAVLFLRILHKEPLLITKLQSPNEKDLDLK